MILSARSLGCRRGGRDIFKDLDFDVASGELLAVTGPNGAGKSSLLRLIAGLLPQETGSLDLYDGDPDRFIGEHAHYVGHLDAVKPVLTVSENLTFWARFHGSDSAKVPEALDRLGIGPLASFPASVLSAGQRRRLALARLLVTRRPLWLLDEPTTGLDRDGRQRLFSMISEHLLRGGLIMAATHADLLQVTQTLELGGSA